MKKFIFNIWPNLFTNQTRIFFQKAEMLYILNTLNKLLRNSIPKSTNNILQKLKVAESADMNTCKQFTRIQQNLFIIESRKYLSNVTAYIKKIENTEQQISNRLTSWQYYQHIRIQELLTNITSVLYQESEYIKWYRKLRMLQVVLKYYNFLRILQNPQTYSCVKSNISFTEILLAASRRLIIILPRHMTYYPRWVQGWQASQLFWFQELKTDYIYSRLKRNYKYLTIIYLKRTLNNYFVTITNGCGEVLFRKSLGEVAELKENKKKRDNNYIRTRLLGLTLKPFPYPPTWMQMQIKAQSKAQHPLSVIETIEIKAAVESEKKIVPVMTNDTESESPKKTCINEEDLNQDFVFEPIQTIYTNVQTNWQKRLDTKVIKEEGVKKDGVMLPYTFQFDQLSSYTQPYVDKPSDFLRWLPPENFQSHRAKRKYIWMQKTQGRLSLKKHTNNTPKYKEKRIMPYPLLGKSLPFISLLVKVNFDFEIVDQSLDLYFRSRPMLLYGVEYYENIAYNGCRLRKAQRRKVRTRRQIPKEKNML